MHDGERDEELEQHPARRRPRREPPHRHTLKLLVAPVIFLVICTNIANVMWPTLSQDHPLTLIALSSINRYLLLVSDQLDPVSFYAVGTARLLVSDPLFFLLGYWYGDRAVAWMESKAPHHGDRIRRLETVFAKAAWPLVLVAPNNIICLLAGAAGMRVGVFFTVNLIGTVGRLYLIRVLGNTLDAPLDWFRDVVGEYQWWFVGASFLLVMVSFRGQVSSGGDLDQLVHLDEELGAEDAEDDR